MGALAEEEAAGIKGRVERNETNPIARRFFLQREEKQGMCELSSSAKSVGFHFQLCVDCEFVLSSYLFFLSQDFVGIGVISTLFF